MRLTRAGALARYLTRVCPDPPFLSLLVAHVAERIVARLGVLPRRLEIKRCRKELPMAGSLKRQAFPDLDLLCDTPQFTLLIQ